MKIATWNVNSIRTRLEQVLNWLQTNPVDVLCLQETKVEDEKFPRSPFLELGYHLYTCGQKAYNGVALISQTPLTQVSLGLTPILEGTEVAPAAAEFDAQKRVIAGVTGSGIRIVNLYVPNGSEVGSEKYDYKLRWLRVLQEYLRRLLAKQGDRLLICGDFNIALEDRDIYDPQGKAQHIMASPAERQALQTVLDLGFADAFRKFTAETGHFSWWDYRAGSFPRNRGWRIDHHYLTPDLYQQAIACRIDTQPRHLPQPSDHAPVVVELNEGKIVHSGKG